MLVQPKFVTSLRKDSDEDLRIEKWIKHEPGMKAQNNRSQNKSNNLNGGGKTAANDEDDSPDIIEISIIKSGSKDNLLTTKVQKAKSSETSNLTQSSLDGVQNVCKIQKAVRHSLPIKSSEIKPIAKIPIKSIGKNIYSLPSFSNENINVKRLNNSLSDKNKVSPETQTVAKHSLPIKCTEIRSINKKVSEKNVDKKVDSYLKNSSSESVNIKRFNNTLINEVEGSVSKIQKVVRHSLPIQNSELHPRIFTMPKSTKNATKNATINVKASKKDRVVPQTGAKIAKGDPDDVDTLKNLLCKEKDSDVFTSLVDNYRYLITPKSWSVTEYISEENDRYIVFSNSQVIKENDVLISVINKSLIIDKEATMNYSVHGLPIDIKGTILPKTLDNTKKLLSILHIFDKMQVCSGLGSELDFKQTDIFLKDSCRFWRHKDCKIVLIKATQCSICTETKKFFSNRNMIRK